MAFTPIVNEGGILVGNETGAVSGLTLVSAVAGKYIIVDYLDLSTGAGATTGNIFLHDDTTSNNTNKNITPVWQINGVTHIVRYPRPQQLFGNAQNKLRTAIGKPLNIASTSTAGFSIRLEYHVE